MADAKSSVRPRSLADEYTGPGKATFLSEEWHRKDLAACYRPRWLVAGHVDELSVPNSYLVFRLGEEEAVIRRGRDGQLRAFRNHCPHRGTRLCDGPTGVAASTRIVCPYHSWVFDPDDGSLLRANHMHADLDTARYGLGTVHVEDWNGLVFVCLADEAPPPPSEFLREMDFAGRDFSRMKLAYSKTHEIRANWKVVVENNSECYHCLANHPELCVVYDWQSLFTTEQEFVDYCDERARGEHEVWQMPVRSYHTIDNRIVVDVPTPHLEPDPTVDDEWGVYLGWEPGVALNISRDLFWVFVPKPVSAGLTELRQMWLVNEDAVEGRDYDLDSLTEFWNVTMQQDRALCEAVQRGMADPGYSPGPLNRRHQRGQAGFYHWYATQILRRFPDSDPHTA